MSKIRHYQAELGTRENIWYWHALLTESTLDNEQSIHIHLCKLYKGAKCEPHEVPPCQIL